MSETLEIATQQADGRTLSGGDDPDALKAAMDSLLERRYGKTSADSAPSESTSSAIAEDAGAIAGPAAEPVVESQPPKPTRGAKRFDQLTGEREAARREAAAAKAEADTVKRERDDLKARLDAASRPAPMPPAQTAPTGRTKPTEDQVGTKYPTYGDYVEDLADWKADQRLAAVDFDARVRQSIEVDRASRTFADQHRQQDDTGRKVYADFDAVAYNGPGALVPISPDRLHAIFTHPQSAHVRYAIGKDPALAQRIAHASPFDVGAMLERLAPPAAVASSASTAHAGSAIAPPYQPVGSGSKTTVPPSAELVSRGYDFDRSGYRERRAAERGVQRRRP